MKTYSPGHWFLRGHSHSWTESSLALRVRCLTLVW
ncbi:YXWGXW repeat-containing protein [Eikenella corrodens]